MKNSNLCCAEIKAAKSKSLPSKDPQLLLAQYAKAIGNPIRLQILQILKIKNSCICGELVDELPIAQATVSQHLKVLKDAGLIQGKISGPATCYCLNQAAIKEFKSLIKQF